MADSRRLWFETLESRQVLSVVGGALDYDEMTLASARGGPPKTSGPEIDLPTVVAHELGHSLGLDHSSSPDCGGANQPIMCPYYIGPAFRLMPEDVSKIRALYPSGTVVVNPNDGRWDDPSITFSFVPDGTAMESPGKGSDLFAKMQQALGSNWQSVFRQALNLWAEATDADGTPDSNSLDNALRFTEHIDNGRPFDFSGLSQGDANAGDIRIGAHKFDSPGGVLAHAYFPPPNSITAAGDAHFASEENWKNLSGLALSPSTAPISTGGGHGSGGSANYGALRHSDAQANDLALLAFFSPPTPGTSSARAIAEEDVILPIQTAAPREQPISIETAAGCMESDDDLVTFSNKVRDRATDGGAVTTVDLADWLPNSALL